MKTVTVEEASQHLMTLIENAQKHGHQCRITSQEGSVVLLPEETYQNLVVTLELLATPGLMDGIKDLATSENLS